MVKNKTVQISGELHKKLKQRALQQNTTVKALLEKLISKIK